MSAATTLPAAVESVAYALAEAEVNATRAAEVLADATARRDRITARISVLNGERAGIVARRQRGEGADDDGARLALIGADLEGLASLLSDAEAVVAQVRQPHQDAQRALAAARHELSRMQAQCEEDALVEYLRQLEAGMRTGMERLAALHVQLGRGRPAWAPATETMLALRRAASAGGTL